MIDSVAASLGRLDAVVNCAVSFVARGLDVTGPDWDHVLRVNVQGISNVVQAAHPLLAATEGAAVVNTASVSAHVAQPSRWTYNATKGAIVSLTRCMAMDLAPDGIRVNAVSPGWIWTPEVSRAANGDRARWEPVWGRFHLLRRLGEPEEVATAIAFLCSSDASFITGTDLAVDGGYMAMGPEGLGRVVDVRVVRTPQRDPPRRTSLTCSVYGSSTWATATFRVRKCSGCPTGISGTRSRSKRCSSRDRASTFS